MNKRTDKKRLRNTDGLVVFMENTYLERTSRPIYAITFLLPMIFLYEIGTILFNTGIDHSQIRVVSFVWIQEMLGFVGLTSKTAAIGAPVVVITILIAMQITSKKSWKFRFNDHFIMIAECVCLAIPLIVLSLFLNRPQIQAYQYQKAELTTQNLQNTNNIEPIRFAKTADNNSLTKSSNLWGIIVTGVGAGIYEELTFRLVLICVLMMVCQDALGIRHDHSIIISVIASALIFSLHHHFIFTNGKITIGETFAITRFIFRTFAGVYFAILYAVRGFGITVATHSFYDIIIAILNAFVFSAAD